MLKFGKSNTEFIGYWRKYDFFVFPKIKFKVLVTYITKHWSFDVECYLYRERVEI